MTLAEALAGTFESGLSRRAGTSEAVSDKPAETNETAATGDVPPKIPAIGSLAMVLEGLIPSQGSARAAAQEISRLAEALAEMTEGEAAGDTAVPPVEHDDNIAAARGESPG